MAIHTYKGFILTRNWRDTQAGIELEFWFSTPQGPVCAVIRGERSAFFINESEAAQARELLISSSGVEFKPVKLRDFGLEPVVAVYFHSHRLARRSADLLRDKGLHPLEADVNPAERFLMERFITGSALLRGEPRERVLVAPSEVEAEGHARKIVQVLSLFIRCHAILKKRIGNLLSRYYLLVKKLLIINGLHGYVSTMFPSERGLHIYPPRI